MLPSLFLSHGSPMLPLTTAPARGFLQQLGAGLERPRAILVASAHWETARPAVNAVAANATIHDFFGFPPALYELRYPAPGAPELAGQVAARLRGAGFATDIDTGRGLDHGAWVPLLLMYPLADIPVLQVSVQPQLGPVHHLRLGQALAPLRAEGVLVIGSGSLTHNLGALRGHGLDDPAPAWVDAFADWCAAALAEGRTDDLLAYRRLAPFAERNHPTEEHLLPLFVALGAAGEAARARHLHASTTHGVLRMDVYGFQDAAEVPAHPFNQPQGEI
ncbi:4,5-DOPA dioxygenase extradiol [Rhodovastum atsumiense]|uniref:Dioxygenase n=1 Tax=Rhodovastum atsumiense TaxID=504468 RepID=A0A5M6INI2_9PROT|nr:class III extradiol ring-cleavage dioxygenase [Rhodovastum atsumiense]KAA5609469.1 dioxygenase [Rhodovastum atsumiense]CAH2603555.1 4,5-DOPA dioxygenase extradiol [Rhodovastum atsumiense]